MNYFTFGDIISSSWYSEAFFVPVLFAARNLSSQESRLILIFLITSSGVCFAIFEGNPNGFNFASLLRRANGDPFSTRLPE